MPIHDPSLAQWANVLEACALAGFLLIVFVIGWVLEPKEKSR